MGFRVTGIEQNPGRAGMVNRGENYINDEEDAELARVVKDGLLPAVTNFATVPELDVVELAVPTPHTRNGTPDLTYLENLTRAREAPAPRAADHAGWPPHSGIMR